MASKAPLPSDISSSGISSGIMTPAEEGTARTLIFGLLHRYASLAREDTDFGQVAALFVPGAVVRLPDGREVPPLQLEELTRSDPPKMLRHHLTTTDIQFESPDKAHCRTYVVAGTDVKMPDHWGRWEDVVSKQSDSGRHEGRWLFEKKVIVPEGMDPQGWLAQKMDADRQRG